MHAITVSSTPVHPTKRARARQPAPALRFSPGRRPAVKAAPDDDDELQRRHLEVLQALADARAQARRIEARLRSRLVALTWPAALSAIAGGFAAVVGLRLAGL